jgi:hypothetical protein
MMCKGWLTLVLRACAMNLCRKQYCSFDWTIKARLWRRQLTNAKMSSSSRGDEQDTARAGAGGGAPTAGGTVVREQSGESGLGKGEVEEAEVK